MSHRYTFVIFDFDGTLADSLPWFGSVLNEVARRYRFREVRAEDRDELRGKDSVEICRYLGLARWKLPFVARHMRKLAARDIAQIELFPGIAPLLVDLHAAGIRLGIVSSNALANVKAVLGPDIVPRIEITECGTSMFGKAARFRRILKRAGVDARDAIAIGDESRDLEAASEVGIASGAVAWGYASAASLAARGPTLMFDRVAEIFPGIVPAAPKGA